MLKLSCRALLELVVEVIPSQYKTDGYQWRKYRSFYLLREMVLLQSLQQTEIEEWFKGEKVLWMRKSRMFIQESQAALERVERRKMATAKEDLNKKG